MGELIFDGIANGSCVGLVLRLAEGTLDSRSGTFLPSRRLNVGPS